MRPSRIVSRGLQAFAVLLAMPAWAHVVSMSSGDLTVEGSRGHYELRMPLYEVAHVAAPDRTLLEHIRFASGGRTATLLSTVCRTDAAADSYFCAADYDFGAPPERIEVECTFASVTVPNHVHMLRAQMGEKHDQAVFDRAFTEASLRFRPPTAAEVAMSEAGAGILRALGGVVQLLFLAALVVAARSRRELLALVGMFLAGEAVAVFGTPHTNWQPAARFVEAAAALTVAYLAIEILLLPKAGARWAVAGALGVFHGLYFYLFVQSSGYRPGWVMAGAGFAEVAAVAILALAFSRIGRLARALRPVQVSASALFVFGLVWFVMRLRG
jgi:hypothetical protein